MKENMLDVLFYLFENYSDQNPSEDRKGLQNYLLNAGFHHQDIERALAWLERLAETATTVAPATALHPLRLYALEEQKWINQECQGHLFFLEQAGILNATIREQVIDQVIALEDAEFDLDKLKWVILMIMLNRQENQQDHQENAYDNTLTEAQMDFLWLDSVTTDRAREHYH
ncbi:MAG TPA: DUF494 domain-containing protein [Thiothrix sp.]|nr:DUF494 domain-containing protein [Thiothrix sp.]